jgi:hypothetical protein
VIGFIVGVWLMRSLNAAAGASPPADAASPPLEARRRHG